MKNLLISALFFFSIAGFAESITVELSANTRNLALPAYVLECKKVGREKLLDQAASLGVEIDIKTLRVSGTDANSMAKYVWWAADVTKVNGRTDVFPRGKKAVLQILTQKPRGGSCF